MGPVNSRAGDHNRMIVDPKTKLAPLKPLGLEGRH
jgi:hypothetical protein